MIVATAGHIDHGKTSLVRALTGVDTDRLPEEKARGISIDLGFAYWPQDNGALIGFVDVPGHERFVRNMLAGVCGIDYALVVVAADDGVMPQTIEHVRILDLLGIARGLAVISKADRADEKRLSEVRADVAALLATTRLAGCEIVVASTVTRQGLDAIERALASVAGELRAREREHKNFRLIIDRAFTIGGSGTIVTGTVVDGAVKAGDRLRLSPGGAPVRVRTLQVGGHSVEQAGAGERCAVNVTGVGIADVARGDWLVHDAIHAPTTRLDVELCVLPDRPAGLPHGSRVHLHLGAGETVARVAIAGGAALAPGTSGFAQLVLDAPIAALHGDRFVVRDPSARHTIGGGRVLDPFARPLRRSAEQQQRLHALRADNAQDALRDLLDLGGPGVDLDRFEVMFNLAPDRALALCRALDAEVIGERPRIAMPRSRWAALTGAVEPRLAAFHQSAPVAVGMPSGALRRELAPSLSSATFTVLLHRLSGEQRVVVAGGLVRLPGHDVSANPADRRMWERIYPFLLETSVDPPTVAELAIDAQCDERALRDMLYRRRTTGGVWRVGKDRFYLRAAFASLAASAAALAASSADQSFSAAQYRDAIGTGRTLAIEILEALDAAGITVRLGDKRRMQHDFVPLLGPAAPVRAANAASSGSTTKPRATHHGKPVQGAGSSTPKRNAAA